MKDDLSGYINRPKRYDNIDGTGEIFMGLMLLGFATVGYIERNLAAQSFWMRHGVLLMYSVLALFLGLGFLVQKLVKRGITFPRTGYVALGSIEKPVVTKAKGLVYGAILGAVFAVVLCLIFIPLFVFGKHHPVSLEAGRLLYAGLFVLVYGFWIVRMGQGQRWKWGVLGLCAAVLLMLAIMIPAKDGFLDGFFPMTALCAGLAWILSGIGTLITYLCKHPTPNSAP